MPTLGGWHLSDLRISGVDPFTTDAPSQGSAAGRASFVITPEAQPLRIGLDSKTGEGAGLDTEYCYIIRPATSCDPADNLTLFLMREEGRITAIASHDPLTKGKLYSVIAAEVVDPVTFKGTAPVCFAEGTRIATKRGPVAVQDLEPGMRIQTADNGFRELLWVGRWRVNGIGQNVPVRLEAGVLGNDRPLELSARHRLVIRPSGGPLAGEEVLVPAKSLVGMRGVTQAPRPRVLWLHLLFEDHEIIFAEGARAESMMPGHATRRTVEKAQAVALERALGHPLEMALPARAILPPKQIKRLSRHHSTARVLGFED